MSESQNACSTGGVPIRKSNILVSAKVIESENKKKKIEDKLNVLMNNLFRILKNEKINELSYGFIYDLCYQISIEKGGDLLCAQYNQNLENFLVDLYHTTVEYLNVNEASFLKKMASDYIDYMNKIVIIQKTLLYHEKNYLLKKNLPNVKVNSKNIYDRIFLNDKIKEILIKFVNEKIENDRNGLLIDKFIIKDTVNILLDINEIAYSSILEPSILANTKDYYQQDYARNIQIKNPMEFSIYVKNRIKDEEQRISDLNLGRSKNKILKILIEELTEKFVSDENVIIPYIIGLMKLNDYHHMAVLKDISMFYMEEKFIEIFGQSVEINGKELIKEKLALLGNINSQSSQGSQVSQSGGNYNNEEAYLSLIQSVLDFLDKLEIFKKEMDILKNKNYLKILFSRIRGFVNSKEYPYLVAKLLPKHIDYSFKNFNRTKANNIETMTYVEKVINLTRFLIDKDVFELNHRRLLSFRLLNNTFYEDVETKFLGKLKLENGTIYTHRCEVIINDLKQSNNMMEQYKFSQFYHKNGDSTKDTNNVDFNIKVLTQVNWIVNSGENVSTSDVLSYANSKFSNNFKFTKILDFFEKFYSHSYHNKKLYHNFFLGTCEVFSRIKNRNYSITMTPFQAFVCLLFSKENPKINFSEMRELFKIKDLKSIINNLIPLIKSGLILVDQESKLMEMLKQDEGLTTSEEISFQFNSNFFNKQQRLKISHMRYITEKISKSEESQGESVQLERKYLIEANIIRIMKSRKNYSHNDLINDILNSVSNIFVPEINQLKQRIESLIERGYLARSEEDYHIYSYTA